MDEKKDGISVREIEEFTKKHLFEVFFCALFVLACIFGSMGFFKPIWSFLAIAVGGVLSVLLPEKCEGAVKGLFQFVARQDKTVQLVIAIIAFVFAIFIPLIIFLLIGLLSGRGMYQLAMSFFQKK